MTRACGICGKLEGGLNSFTNLKLPFKYLDRLMSIYLIVYIGR